VLVAYLVIATAGAVGALVVALTAGLGLGLTLLMRRPDSPVDPELVRALATGALLLAPAAMTVWLSFRQGGFFPEGVAWGVVMLAALLLVRCALAPAPLRGVGPWVLVPSVALALLAVWTLASSQWSDSPGRALLEFDRVALYGLAFVLFGSLGRSTRRLRLAVTAMAAAITLVAGVAFVSRVAPDVLATTASFRTDRLSFPLLYWNALGVLCSIGLVLCLHLTASTREPAVVRVLAAGAVPLIAPTLLLTYSRGGMGAAVVGVVVYAVAAHPRGLLSALLATAPVTAIALSSAYDATLLSEDEATSAAAVAQGHHVAGVVIGCALAAFAVRAVLLFADTRLDRMRLPDRARRPIVAGAWVTAAVSVMLLAAALDAPTEVRQGYEQFVNERNVGSPALTRDRLGSTSNQGRLAHWRAALKGFDEDRLKGTGGGTYGHLWMQYREPAFFVLNAHGLYQETLGELGFVGLALLVIALGAIVVGLVPFRRGPDRCVYAALLACAVAWLAHAGLDWDWEMPATALWLFALGGLALGRARGATSSDGVSGSRIVAPTAVGLLALGLAVLAWLVLASQYRLDASVTAFRGNDCPTALAEARSASEVLGFRPEPHEVVGLCLTREGKYREAVRALDRALELDPRNWELHYSRSVVQAALGRDPRPGLAAARRLNPFFGEEPLLSRAPRRRATRGRWARTLAPTLYLSGRW
jgi:O-antigen ligase